MAKKLADLSPDEVCAEIQKQIRRLFGDDVENQTNVYAYHGAYVIEGPLICLNQSVRRKTLPAVFKAWRRGDDARQRKVAEDKVRKEKEKKH